ncbi:MAG: hypothetical protein WCD11_06065 [Solirubrobacteraceae bacterium]
MSNFEDQLWSQLLRERGEQMRAAPGATAALASSVTATRPATQRAPRLRRPALLTGSALGIAGLATAGVFAITSASPAFAVTKNPDGTVAITLSDLSDLPALNQKLAQDGVPVTAVPISTSCSATAAIDNPSGESTPNISADRQETTDVVTIDPRQIPSGDIGVLGASQTASGQVTLLFGDTTPPAPSCLNSAAFNRSQAGDTSTRGTP